MSQAKKYGHYILEELTLTQHDNVKMKKMCKGWIASLGTGYFMVINYDIVF